jgi:uncharacterized membrane protein
MAIHEMPLVFSRSPGFATKFLLTRLVITYGAMATICFANGIGAGFGAFLFYMVFSVITFFIGSRRVVKKWAQIEFRKQKQETAERGETFDEYAGWHKATKHGELIVEENIRRNGNL